MQLSTKTPETKCPACHHKLDGAARVDGDGNTPQPGDVTVCLYCGHICAYGDDLQLRELNDKEAYDVAGDPDILAAVELSGMYREYLKKENKNGNEREEHDDS